MIHKEFIPPRRKDPVVNSRITNTGLTATPQLSEADQAMILFSDLNKDPEGGKTVLKHFQEEYLDTIHRGQSLEMVELYDKNKDAYSILARLPTVVLCLEWEKFYVDKSFLVKSQKLICLNNFE